MRINELHYAMDGFRCRHRDVYIYVVGSVNYEYVIIGVCARVVRAKRRLCGKYNLCFARLLISGVAFSLCS